MISILRCTINPWNEGNILIASACVYRIIREEKDEVRVKHIGEFRGNKYRQAFSPFESQYPKFCFKPATTEQLALINN